jgi:hypothetical protein
MRQVLLFVLAMGGCDRCSAPPPPPEHIEDELARVLEPEPQEVTALWQRASASLAVSEIPAASVRYTVPSCPLRWEVRWLQLSEVAEGREPVGVEVVGEISGTPKGEELVLGFDALRSEALADGSRAVRPVSKPSLAPAVVVTDGIRWRDTETSPLWRASSAIPPLSTLFAPLPEKVGAREKWDLTLASTPVPAGKEQPIEEMHAEVELSGLIEVGGVPAAVVTGLWPRRRAAEQPLLRRQVEKWRGRFVILASGRLFYAAAVAQTWQWWSPKPGEENEKLGRAEMELRLVEACDGPTLPRFELPH